MTFYKLSEILRLQQQTMDIMFADTRRLPDQLVCHNLGMLRYYMYSHEDRIAYLIIASGQKEYDDTHGIEDVLKQALEQYPEQPLIHLVGGYKFTPMAPED